MKVRIRSATRKVTLVLPTRMIFNPWLMRFGVWVGKQYSSETADLSPQKIHALCAQIRRIKNTYKRWEFVNVQTADGTSVQIYL